MSATLLHTHPASAQIVARERLFLLNQVDTLAKKLGKSLARKAVVEIFNYGGYPKLKQIHRLSVRTLQNWLANRIAIAPQTAQCGRHSRLSKKQIFKIVTRRCNNPHLTWAKIAAVIAVKNDAPAFKNPYMPRF